MFSGLFAKTQPAGGDYCHTGQAPAISLFRESTVPLVRRLPAALPHQPVILLPLRLQRRQWKQKHQNLLL